MPVSDHDIAKAAEEGARIALQEFTARAVPPGSLSRDEFRALIEDAAAEAVRTVVEKTIVPEVEKAVDRRVKELLKSIGLNLDEPAETASKILALFKLHKAIGQVVLWGAIGLITAAFVGIGGFIAKPWQH